MICSIGLSAEWTVERVFFRFGVPVEIFVTSETVRGILTGFGIAVLLNGKAVIVVSTSTCWFLMVVAEEGLGAGNPMLRVSNFSDVKILNGFSLKSGISLKSKLYKDADADADEDESHTLSKKLKDKKINDLISTGVCQQGSILIKISSNI